ncbi:hypothetical protein JTE90_028857 [Oedothorax gibbosus]|uniref:Uncharacterized protein n=1 Tax=Oedothorax gibbosus TaxID=931172 RepID=A0AAV6U904_9ARAC|nr:hypothetical protein JTE90_028857 [Oedothorax gibbosus]
MQAWYQAVAEDRHHQSESLRAGRRSPPTTQRSTPTTSGRRSTKDWSIIWSQTESGQTSPHGADTHQRLPVLAEECL